MRARTREAKSLVSLSQRPIPPRSPVRSCPSTRCSDSRPPCCLPPLQPHCDDRKVALFSQQPVTGSAAMGSSPGDSNDHHLVHQSRRLTNQMHVHIMDVARIPITVVQLSNNAVARFLPKPAPTANSPHAPSCCGHQRDLQTVTRLAPKAQSVRLKSDGPSCCKARPAP